MKILCEIRLLHGNGKSEVITQEWADIPWRRTRDQDFPLVAQRLAHEVCFDLTTQPEVRSRE